MGIIEARILMAIIRRLRGDRASDEVRRFLRNDASRTYLETWVIPVLEILTSRDGKRDLKLAERLSYMPTIPMDGPPLRELEPHEVEVIRRLQHKPAGREISLMVAEMLREGVPLHQVWGVLDEGRRAVHDAMNVENDINAGGDAASGD